MLSQAHMILLSLCPSLQLVQVCLGTVCCVVPWSCAGIGSSCRALAGWAAAALQGPDQTAGLSPLQTFTVTLTLYLTQLL